MRLVISTFFFINVALASSSGRLLEKSESLCGIDMPSGVRVSGAYSNDKNLIRVFFTKDDPPYFSIHGIKAYRGQIECNSRIFLDLADLFVNSNFEIPKNCKVQLNYSGHILEVNCKSDQKIIFKGIAYVNSLVLEENYFDYPVSGKFFSETEVLGVKWPERTSISTNSLTDQVTFEIYSEFKYRDKVYKPRSTFHFKKDGTLIQVLGPDDEI